MFRLPKSTAADDKVVTEYAYNALDPRISSAILVATGFE